MRDKFNTSIHRNTNKTIKKPANETITQDDDFKLPPVNDDLEDQDIDDITDAFDQQFFDKHYEEIAPVFLASNKTYDKYKAKYANEIGAISDASKKIKPPTATRTEYQIQNKINQWSHQISIDTLNIIFQFAININEKVLHANDMKLYDMNKDPRRFTIILVHVCKNWRLCCLNNDEFWHGVMEWVVRGGKHRDMTWKKLMTVPSKYLNKFCTSYNVENMTEDEKIQYDKILAENGFGNDDSDDEYGYYDESFQTNVFLIIQCLKYCGNTWRVYLSGVLCDDIFYAIGKYCNGLRQLSVPFIQSGNSIWFRHLVKEDSKCMDTLFRINLERSYWVDDDALKYLGKLRNLQSIEMDRLYSISANGLKYLFEGENGEVRGKEMRNIYLTRGMKYYNDTVDFMKLMIKNGNKMIQFEFTECEGFNDDMLKLLVNDKNALPDLRAVNIRYTGCSKKMVKRFEQNRPNVEIDFEEAEW
eukprot:285860_1